MIRPSLREDHISQIPALQLLQNMGFIYLTPEEALSQRKNRLSNVLLEGILEERLKAINSIPHRGKQYPFSDANIKATIKELYDYPSNEGYISANKLLYDALVVGRSFDQIIEGDKKGRSLKYIDWNNSTNNVFHVTEEFAVQRTGRKDTYRPDIVLFVNGIPLVVIECKRPDLVKKDPIQAAIEQHLRNQKEDGIRNLFVFSQLVVSICTDAAKFGTTNTSAEFWSVWKEQYKNDISKRQAEQTLFALVNRSLSKRQKNRLFSDRFQYVRKYFDTLEQENRAVTAQDSTLFHLCQPSRLLDIIHDFTTYDNGIKKVARYQQFFAVNNTVERIGNFQPDGTRLGGVIWHTQGSGKSLTMVMLAKKIMQQKEIDNPKVVLVTDRVDLDDQIYETFGHCKIPVKQATSGKKLLELLEKDSDVVVTTLIHKFETAVKRSKKAFIDPNIFVLVDEGHRSQFGVFHTSMKRVFKKGCFIGFTGTPLMKKDKNTAYQFGGVIDKYTILSAVNDGAVVPLLFEGRHVAQEVNQKILDSYFKRIAEPLTTYQKGELKKKVSRADQLNKAEQKIMSIAFDISDHYSKNYKNTPFKAQLVTPDKLTAIKFKSYLDRIGKISSEVIISPPDMREGDKQGYPQTHPTIKQFYKKLVDDRGKDYEKNIIADFKDSNKSPELIIVVDKLLTGFDAPINRVLYVARNLKEHTLLQAIARVNRVYPGKDYGLIIDYYGILSALNEALETYSRTADYSAEDLEGMITNVKNKIKDLPQKHSELWDLFKHIQNKADLTPYQAILADEAIRQQFYERFSIFVRLFKLAMTTIDFVENTPENSIKRYKEDVKFFQGLRVSVKRLHSEGIDYKQYEAEVQRLIDQHVVSDPDDILKITELVNIFDKEAFEQEIEKLTSPRAKADTIASRTARYISENMNEDPVFFKKLSELIEEVIEAMRQKRISEAEALQKVKEYSKQATERTNSDIPIMLHHKPVAQAFFSQINENINTSNQVSLDAIAKSSITINQIVKDFVLFDGIPVVDWHVNGEIERKLKQELDDFLYDYNIEYQLSWSDEQIDILINELITIAKNNYV